MGLLAGAGKYPPYFVTDNAWQDGRTTSAMQYFPMHAGGSILKDEYLTDVSEFFRDRVTEKRTVGAYRDILDGDAGTCNDRFAETVLRVHLGSRGPPFMRPT